MSQLRYKILINGELKHTDLPYSTAIDFMMKYLHESGEVTIKSYYP